MLIAMRRNRQVRDGRAFIQELSRFTEQTINLELIAPEKTVELERSILEIVRNDRGLLSRESGLSWDEIEPRFANFLHQSDSGSFSVLLCSKPEFSFISSEGDLKLILKGALEIDGETIYIVETAEHGQGFGIDKYEEGGKGVFEFDLFKF